MNETYEKDLERVAISLINICNTSYPEYKIRVVSKKNLKLKNPS